MRCDLPTVEEFSRTKSTADLKDMMNYVRRKSLDNDYEADRRSRRERETAAYRDRVSHSTSSSKHTFFDEDHDKYTSKLEGKSDREERGRGQKRKAETFSGRDDYVPSSDEENSGDSSLSMGLDALSDASDLSDDDDDGGKNHPSNKKKRNSKKKQNEPLGKKRKREEQRSSATDGTKSSKKSKKPKKQKGPGGGTKSKQQKKAYGPPARR